jgi:hypothetical protein
MEKTTIFIVEERGAGPDSDALEKCCICNAQFYFSSSYYILNYEVSDDTNDDFYTNEVQGFVCFTCANESEPHLRQLLGNQSKNFKRHSLMAAQFVGQFSWMENDKVKAICDIANLHDYDIVGSLVESDLFARMSEGEIFIQKLSDAEAEYRGFVYLLGSPEGYCKIGRTINLQSRLHSIGLQLPFKVELLHTIKVSDPVKAERFLHKKFADCRTNGEWFLLSIEQINWIKEQASLEGLY